MIELQLLFLKRLSSSLKIETSKAPSLLSPGKEVNIIFPEKDFDSIKS